jgi:hypothetical protein
MKKPKEYLEELEDYHLDIKYHQDGCTIAHTKLSVGFAINILEEMKLILNDDDCDYALDSKIQELKIYLDG